MAETVERVVQLLDTPVTVVGSPLASSSRNLVLRVANGGRTYVVKRRLTDEPSPEGAALSALSRAGSTVTPELIAADGDVLVMADLGSHPHLASYLLGSDPLAARRAMLAWGAALGRFHGFGLSAAPAFGAAASSHADYMPGLLDEAAVALVTSAADLGVVVRHEFAALTDVRFRTPLEVLSAGDMCPDNNLVEGAAVNFIDLEFATTRHLAWDVAYLYVPWPSCWCAWRLPERLADEAFGEWRRTFEPDVHRQDLADDVQLAADAWRWLSVSWLLPSLATGWPTRSDRPAPPVADRLVHSLDALARSEVFSELRYTATELAQSIRVRFQVGTLHSAPAWR